MSPVRQTLVYATNVAYTTGDEADYRESLRNCRVRLRLGPTTTSTEEIKPDPVSQLISAWLQRPNKTPLISNGALQSCQYAFQIRSIYNPFVKVEERLSCQDVARNVAETIAKRGNISLDHTRSYDDLRLPDWPTSDDMTSLREQTPDFPPQVNFFLDSNMSAHEDSGLTDTVVILEDSAKDSMTAAEHLEKLLSDAIADAKVQAALTDDTQTTYLANIVDQALLKATIQANKSRLRHLHFTNIMGAYLSKQN